MKHSGVALGFLCGLVLSTLGSRAEAVEPVPDKVVVLTFDDSIKSHFSVVRPILKKYKFGATFFITEGFEFKTNKEHYMTWDEIAHLHQDGFEIGNHTRDHMALNPAKPELLKKQLAELKTQLETIDNRCREYGIPKTTSFAYPGNGVDAGALPILKQAGIRFARRGGAPEYKYEEGKGVAYEPGLDHPLLIPTAGDARPGWTFEDFKRAVELAQFGRIAVLQFHGVPDLAHSWVNTPVTKFEQYMQYLADNDFTVIAMRDLTKYIDPETIPRNPDYVIGDRQAAIKAGESRNDFRAPANDVDLKYWLQNMVWHHNFTVAEIRMATGLDGSAITAALKKWDIRPETRPPRDDDAPLLVLPYPGGRHPRISFLDGALRPQRETKLSVFTPWDDRSYLVVDVPEAIRRNDERTHGLLYLAHTHVDTMWTKQGVDLEQLEWRRNADGSLECERTLPNKVVFGTRVVPGREAVRMEMWLTNGSDETLSNLRVQNCVMMKAAADFAHQGNENTLDQPPYAARRSLKGNRWFIVAWTPCLRTWFNPPCPCLHSDPQFPDCKPGETKRLQGWMSFYEGDDIQGELKRIDATGWQTK
ncbi:MAG: hypothetical protein CMJ48_05250 [Planctomycetaceae bacterium]|nr:hypothetical protein [Planctomycetaceae bacterium]